MSESKRRILGIASTPYHLMVLLFLKDAFFEGLVTDLLITDKTPSFQALFESGKLKALFENVYFANGKMIKNPYKSGAAMLYESLIKNPEFPRLFEDREKPELSVYTDIFFASPGVPDEISKEIIKSAILKNRHVRFHRFEDGFASYTKPPVCSVTSKAGRLAYQLLRGFDIKKAESRLYLFEPYLAEAPVADTGSTGFTLRKIPNDEDRISRVTEQLKALFDQHPEQGFKPYIFLGQGTDNVTNNPKTYASLITEIAQITGYENFCLKPHPRGTYDRFDDKITLYEDPAPFELCFAEGLLEDKTLISYYSTACVSGKLLFHSNCRILFLYPLAGDSFNEKCDYEDYFKKLKELYPGIGIATSREELKALLSR